MELLAKIDYTSTHCTLKAGKTTVGKHIPEEEKARMVRDWPDWFEVLPDTATEEVTDEVIIETPESKMVIETPEAKLPKSRKK